MFLRRAAEQGAVVAAEHEQPLGPQGERRTGRRRGGRGQGRELLPARLLGPEVEPARSAVLSGEERGRHRFQGMGPGFIPPNLDRSVIDRVQKAWEEDAFPMAARLAREEGLFVGMSSGAIVWTAVELARELGPGHRIACIAPDSASRYLSTDLFGDLEEER